ncbi:MAG TPA: quinone oxidoreductase [Solirubrobacterales bacterium]
MKAIQIEKTGGVDVLRLRDLPDPEAGPGTAVVEVAAAGVNYLDIHARNGELPLSLPFVPGFEGAGAITAVHPGDEGDLAVGDRVVWAEALGGYGEYAAIPTRVLVRLPDALDFDDAAALQVQGTTAHYLTHDVYPVEEGDDVLVHAGAGGVGMLITQFAKLAGARVIATASPGKKERALVAGADEVIAYDGFAPRVRELTDGQGVAAVFDGVGAATYAESAASLRPRGTLALFGEASGPVPPFDPAEFGARSAILTRPSFSEFMATREEIVERTGEVHARVLDGSLRASIGARLPLAEAAEAQRRLEARETTGKVLLLPR